MIISSQITWSHSQSPPLQLVPFKCIHRSKAWMKWTIVNAQENLKRFLMIHKTRSKSFECHCRDHHQKRFKMILKTASLSETLWSGLQPQKKSRSIRKFFFRHRKRPCKNVKEFPDWFLDEFCFSMATKDLGKKHSNSSTWKLLLDRKKSPGQIKKTYY